MAKKCIVAGCLVVNGGRLLLLKHKKLGVWLPPGGHMEEGEFPYETAIRETKEETGLDVRLVDSGSITHMDSKARSIEMPFTISYEDVPYKDGSHIHFNMMYLAEAGDDKTNANADEATDIRWFTAEELKAIETYPNVRSVGIAAIERMTK